MAFRKVKFLSDNVAAKQLAVSNALLDSRLEEVRAKRQLSKLEIMQREMETAIAKELYERAAELRDAIKQLKTQNH